MPLPQCLQDQDVIRGGRPFGEPVQRVGGAKGDVVAAVQQAGQRTDRQRGARAEGVGELALPVLRAVGQDQLEPPVVT
jgi:hypothetical protein